MIRHEAHLNISEVKELSQVLSLSNISRVMEEKKNYF